MKNIILKITGLSLALMLAFGINSCVKDDFDQPPVLVIPVGDVKTVAEIQVIASIHDETAPLKITEDMSIFGLITMGEHSGNLYKQAIVEDASGGIQLNFHGSTSLNVGDSIRVNLNGARVYNYGGLPQIDSLDITNNVFKLSAGNTVNIPELTVSDINTGDYTGRVAKVINVQFVEEELDLTFALDQSTENRTLENCSEKELTVRTSGYANFALKKLPAGFGSMVAFISEFNGGAQIVIRSYEEIDMDAERCGGSGNPVDPVDNVYEDFSSQIEYENIDISGWTNLEVIGGKWIANEFDSEKYAQSSTYDPGGNIAEMETWLITPPVKDINQKVLSFRSAQAYWSHTSSNPMTVYISTDFVGNNFEEANWTELNVTMADQSTTEHDWISSGNVDLSAYSGNAAIAFKYMGTATESTTMRIDDIVIDDPTGGGGEWTPNTTIPELKALYAGSRLQITDELILGVTVIANDASGNYYKNIIIQDDAGGIELKINGYDLYNSFPVGQKININCQNLYLDTYGDVIQLGSVYDDNGEEAFGGIDPDVLDDHIETASGGFPPSPNTVLVTDLNVNLLGTLIQLEGVQFVESELGETYADAVTQYSENRTLTDCDGNEVVVRTSGYADFAGETIAEGNGSFIGVLGAYLGTYQLTIRELSDLDLTGERCEIGGGGGGTVDPVDEIDEDFQSFSGYDEIDLENWTNIMVTGDRNWIAGEFSSNIYAQASGYSSGLDAMETWMITPPITNIEDKTLSFKSAIAYWSHTSDHPGTVFVSEDFVGDNFETATWTEIDITIAQESDGDHTWVESGEYDLSAFSGNAAIAFRYIGSDSESTSFRIDDLVVTDGSGGGGGGTVESVNEDFASTTNYEDIDLDGWVNVMVDGDRRWQAKEYDSDKYAQATGYNSGLSNMECWLITPVVSDIGSKSLSLKTAMAYWAHGSDQPLTIYVSTDYDGEDYENATWEAIDVTIANEASGDHNWVESGNVDLSNFDGDAAVAFKYVGSESKSTSIRLDNIVIE